MVKVDPSDILLNFVLGVTAAEIPDGTSEDDESDMLIESPVMGFVYVLVPYSRVAEERCGDLTIGLAFLPSL